MLREGPAQQRDQALELVPVLQWAAVAVAVGGIAVVVAVGIFGGFGTAVEVDIVVGRFAAAVELGLEVCTFDVRVEARATSDQV